MSVNSNIKTYKILALNTNGDLTYCTCPPELRGRGRCNHLEHQQDDETPQDFTKRIEKLKDLGKFKNIAEDRNKPFIEPNATISTKPYRMSEDERKKLFKIENRMQLDQNIDGGYIELDEPLWNDMDKNYFSQMSGIQMKNIERVLYGDGYIILNSDIPKYPEGKVLTEEQMKIVQDKNLPIEVGTGVAGMNKFAKDIYNWEATRYVYVLPYYMRMGVGDCVDDWGHSGSSSGDEELVEKGSDELQKDANIIRSDITAGYQYLMNRHKDPNKQQIAYEALLNNSKLEKNKTRYSGRYEKRSLVNEFVGKGGVFRACLSGSSIPYSARTVITPTIDLKYGEVRIPPTVAVDIFKPTLLKSLAQDGYTQEDIDRYFKACRVPQSEVKNEIRKDLELRIENRRVIMNRQPSLHTPSLQGFVPKISDGPTTQIHPLYCKNYGADFDGDAVTLYGINADDMVPIIDKEIGANLDINTHTPRNIASSAILPSKDALFGLLSILERRTN